MSIEAVSPLRRRMIEDMTIRQFGEHTKRDSIRQVSEFAAFLGRSPDWAEPEDLRRYQLHLASLGASYSRMNLASTALRFFFHTTLGRPGFGDRMARIPTPERLPVVLSPEEVALLLAHASSLKYRAALSVAYGCGLRISEIANLKITDIDSARMLIRVEQGSPIRDLTNRIVAAIDRPAVAPTNRPRSVSGAMSFHFSLSTVNKQGSFSKAVTGVPKAPADFGRYIERDGAAEAVNPELSRSARVADEIGWAALGGQAYIERPEAAEEVEGRKLASFGNIARTFEV